MTSIGKVELATPINFTLKDQYNNIYNLKDYLDIEKII